jgi:hypothetical protein
LELDEDRRGAQPLARHAKSAGLVSVTSLGVLDWPAGAGWAGPVTDETSEAVAEYDYVELYEYEGP